MSFRGIFGNVHFKVCGFVFRLIKGQFCDTHITKNMEICIIGTWNANTLWDFMCTIAVNTNKGVLKLPLVLYVV